MNINWETIGQPRQDYYPKPCCCVFQGSGEPMDMKDCPVHKDISNYQCCGDPDFTKARCDCNEYKPAKQTPTLRLKYLGQPAFATGWARCICGHPAQYHG